MNSLKISRNVELKTEDILFVQSDINYSQFFLCNGRKIVVAKTLKQITEIVQGTSIVRVNRQVMLNALYIKYISITSNAPFAELIDGKTITFSRRRALKAQIHIEKYLI
jgi:DNA-binding LytR/AlgR family response regulator